MMRVLAALSMLILFSACASANFIEVETGARAMGMGGAFVSVADDVTALYWNPAGLAGLDGFQVFGMRTSVYDVDGLSEDSVMASYGSCGRGYGMGWMRTGAADLYNEDTLLAGFGMTTPLDGLSAGATIKRFSVDAPGYDYYNDPNFESGGDQALSGDVGLLYLRDVWRLGATFRNLGEPELQLISSTASEDLDPIYGELRLGGSYVFREVMLMTAEWRVRSNVPSYWERKNSLNLGTEIWFFDVFALRAGVNEGRNTAGLGLKADPVRIDVALLSERRIGSFYRLSAILTW